MLNYTLKQLRYIEAAGRLGSIASAAAELSISQSSITAAIDAVESRLRYDLFIRTPARGIRPTPQGAEALVLIQAFIQKSRHFESEMESVAGDLRGSVRIAFYATAAPAVLPSILRGVSGLFPDISFTVLEASISGTMDLLAKGEADLAFTYPFEKDSRHQFEPLFQAPPFAIVPRGDGLAKQAVVTLAELAERPQIMLDLPGAREYFGTVFSKAGLSPQIAHSTRSSEILRALVGIGFGVAMLNIRPLGYDESKSDFVIVPIKDAPEPPEFGIVTVSGVEQPMLVRKFIESCIAMKNRGDFDHLTTR